jgi:hypothetical protein
VDGGDDKIVKELRLAKDEIIINIENGSTNYFQYILRNWPQIEILI